MRSKYDNHSLIINKYINTYIKRWAPGEDTASSSSIYSQSETTVRVTLNHSNRIRLIESVKILRP